MKRARVLLADDHRIVVEGLRGLLEPEFDIVGAVADGRELVSAAEALHPDVIVVDISMPLLNGIEAVRQIAKLDRAVKVVFLTMHPDVTYAMRALEAGAAGYVLKHSAPSELLTAIRAVLKGRTYVTPLITKDVFQAYIGGSHRCLDPVHTLTPRQCEVLQLLAEGYSAKEVAAALNISPRTAEFHKYRLMELLQLKTSAELVQYAVKHGIVAV
jgi:DNA-binding NarL/FixJ family response regulator